MAMSVAAKRVYDRVVALLDEETSVLSIADYRVLLEELDCDVNARLSALGEDERRGGVRE